MAEAILKASIVALCSGCECPLAEGARCCFAGCHSYRYRTPPKAKVFALVRVCDGTDEANLVIQGEPVNSFRGLTFILSYLDEEILRSILALTSSEWTSLVAEAGYTGQEMVFLRGGEDSTNQHWQAQMLFRLRCRLLPEVDYSPLTILARPFSHEKGGHNQHEDLGDNRRRLYCVSSQ